MIQTRNNQIEEFHRTEYGVEDQVFMSLLGMPSSQDLYVFPNPEAPQTPASFRVLCVCVCVCVCVNEAFFI
jgi:hypothetical protein